MTIPIRSSQFVNHGTKDEAELPRLGEPSIKAFQTCCGIAEFTGIMSVSGPTWRERAGLPKRGGTQGGGNL